MNATERRARIARLQESLTSAGVDGLLVTQPTNVRYLCGYAGSNGVLCVGPERAVLVTDFRYQEVAGTLADAVDVEIAERDILAAVARLAPARFDGASRLGFEGGHLPFGSVAAAREASPDGVEWLPTSGLVEALRMSKTPAEVDAIRAAAEPVAAAYRALAEGGLVGLSERDLAWRVRSVFNDADHDPSFGIIVAGGPTGALPHAVPGTRPIGRGELVVVDIGAVARDGDGYVSDCTRTLAAGAEPAADARADYDLVLRAQRAGLAAARGGAVCGQVDAAARHVIADAGLGGLFGHGLGHGVGLDVHEAPYFRDGNEAIAPSGAVMSVEPGIYRPGRWGVRIEDLVVLRDGGADVLTGGFPTELVVSDG